MSTETKTYRITFFRDSDTKVVAWGKLPEDVLDKIPTGYFYNCRCMSIDKENPDDICVENQTFILINPVKRLRKNETRINVLGVEIGLDDH